MGPSDLVIVSFSRNPVLLRMDALVGLLLSEVLLGG
jgi:hypothetical protein